MKDALKPAWAKQVSIIDLNSGATAPQNESPVIAVGSNLSPETVISTAADQALCQIVQDTSLDAKSAIVSSGHMLFSAEEFLQHPLSCMLDPTNSGPEAEKKIRSVDCQFNSSKQKIEVLQNLEDFLIQSVKRSSTMAEILSVADEMYSNAVFNAPFVNDEDRRGTSRTDGSVTVDRQARFLAGRSENALGIVVIDQYGSLKIDKLLKKIQKTYKEGADNTIQMDGVGGAGLGTYMIFESCSSMYMAVKPGELTIIGVILPLNMSRKKKTVLSKNLHILEVPSKA
ncbi:MAG: hypothetical protein HRT45_10820 [Bdellovibrionales bacterium]|nr:hypothetical protein [Bdellovibrionales bacterium]